jgi:hypothetical protein
MIEGLSGAKKYAPLWPGGTFELGTDAGFPWARVITDGQGGPTCVTNVRPYKPALDYRNKFLKVRIKVDEPDQLESTILGVQRFLEENEFRASLGHLAYPLGRQNTSYVRPLVRKHFLTARVAGAGPETLPPADPHLLRVLNVTNTTTPEEIGAAAAHRAPARGRGPARS